MSSIRIGIVLIVIAIMSSGCIDAKKIGQDAAAGALEQVQRFGDEFAESKNAAELAAAVAKGKEFGISYEEIDTNADGIFDGAEAGLFYLRIEKDKLGGVGEDILKTAMSGDIEGAKIKAKEAGSDVWPQIRDALLAIFTAGASGKFMLDRHGKKVKEQVNEERDRNRMLRREPVHIIEDGTPTGVPGETTG